MDQLPPGRCCCSSGPSRLRSRRPSPGAWAGPWAPRAEQGRLRVALPDPRARPGRLRHPGEGAIHLLYSIGARLLRVRPRRILESNLPRPGRAGAGPLRASGPGAQVLCGGDPETIARYTARAPAASAIPGTTTSSRCPACASSWPSASSSPRPGPARAAGGSPPPSPTARTSTPSWPSSRTPRGPACRGADSPGARTSCRTCPAPPGRGGWPPAGR